MPDQEHGAAAFFTRARARARATPLSAWIKKTGKSAKEREETDDP